MTRKTITTALVFLLTITMIFTTGVGIYAESDGEPLVEEKAPSNPAISLKLERQAISYKLGEAIEYTIRIKNTGDVVLSELLLEDKLAEQEVIETLDVGEELLFERTYIIPLDNDKEFIENEVTLSIDVGETRLEAKDSFEAYMERMSSIELMPESEGEEELDVGEPGGEESDEGDANEEVQESMMAITPFANGSIAVQNYFAASGTSTNNHYSVIGVYVDMNNNIHLLLDNDKATANQIRFHSPRLNGVPGAGFTPENDKNSKDYEPYWQEVGKTIDLSFPDGSPKEITGVRMFDFNLGQMIDHLKESNTLQMLNSAGGFSIEGMTFTLNLGHSITKTVNKPLTTIGDELIYTIKVANTGELRLTGVNVYDNAPVGLTIVEVSEDNATWGAAAYRSNGDIILETGLALAADESKTYYIKAIVNENVEDGKIIKNTAFTGGSVPRQEDTAEVEIEIKVKATIKKIITGNFGDLTRSFDFIVTVDEDDPIEFPLSHNGEKVIQGLPADAILTLIEDNGEYDVTVKVGGNIIPKTNGSYTITLTGEDTTITVTNNYDVPIDTGVPIDSLPYIIILGMVIAGLGIMTVRRRRAGNQY